MGGVVDGDRILGGSYREDAPAVVHPHERMDGMAFGLFEGVTRATLA